MAQTGIPPFIQEMMQPGFYPHPVKEPIQLRQTHVSYVLLTGDYAYKIKKPVNFGFLDFSTLEARQHFCQEEIRMNQQNAPELYLDVLPITETDDGFELNGKGQPVEYTVKMREFPQENIFSSRFEQGDLTEALMEELGRVVAQFHAKAVTNDRIRSFGAVSQIRQAFDENYEQTEKYIGGPQTKQQFEETKQYTDDFFTNRQQLFQRRMQDDWIRECHGDLHLRNICLWKGKIVLFDRIEFNEPFRFVDVMFDIAYAVMDLDARQRSDLANAYLNAYIEQIGDWEGVQILPLYLTRQSYVRAKVTSFLLDDPAVPEDEKKEAEATAANYYRLAWEYTKAQTGRLMLMSGLSGSGKTTVARQIARRTGAIHIRSDAVRKHLAGIPIDQRGTDEIYTAAMSERTYNRLLDLGILLASQGYPVILDAKYDRKDFRQAAIARANQQQIPIQILHCTAPEAVMRDRLSTRHGDVSDATTDLLDRQKATAEPFSDEERPLVMDLDTTQEAAVVAQRVVAEL
jgi:aminoglycoside phosphotransferase family enzyme/gluconate kinase